MKTIQSPQNLSENNLVSLVDDILQAAREDKDVQIEFSAQDYVVFSSGTVNYEQACQIPELLKIFRSHRPTTRMIMSFSYLMDCLLEDQNAPPFSKELYDTAQVIYRFK